MPKGRNGLEGREFSESTLCWNDFVLVDFTKCDLCFARIKSAFEMNNIQRRDVTCVTCLWLAKLQFASHTLVFSEREVFC